MLSWNMNSFSSQKKQAIYEQQDRDRRHLQILFDSMADLNSEANYQKLTEHKLYFNYSASKARGIFVLKKIIICRHILFGNIKTNATTPRKTLCNEKLCLSYYEDNRINNPQRQIILFHLCSASSTISLHCRLQIFVMSLNY